MDVICICSLWYSKLTWLWSDAEQAVTCLRLTLWVIGCSRECVVGTSRERVVEVSLERVVGTSLKRFVFDREVWQMRIDLLNNYQMVKPKKLKLGLNIKINKSVIWANFGDPRPRDRKLRHKKRQILAWKFINSLIIPKPLNVQS